MSTAAASADPGTPRVAGARRFAGAAAAAALFLVLALRYTEPVRDGDLWWQMAYGRQLLSERTLVPDHARYSWTPTRTDLIYCAWLPEIVLFALHAAGGLVLLVCFRYLCMLVPLLLAWQMARRLRVDARPVAWLSMLLGVLMAYSAAYLKPEIFSYVLMSLAVAAWFRLRLGGAAAWRWAYAFPLLIAVWVNSHGGVVFGVAFVLLVALGEELNALYSPALALPLRARRHLFAATALTGFALLATPYGWRYPLQLARRLVAAESAGFRAPLGAYASTFAAGTRALHYPQYLLIAGAVLVVLFVRHTRAHRAVDWAACAVNLVFAVLYSCFLRGTFYWAPLFMFSSLYFLTHAPPWRVGSTGVRHAVRGLAATAFVLLAARAAVESVLIPPGHTRWFGFGVSYFSPVAEAEFIATQLPRCRLGNDYSSGGYLLWRLWPDRRVFIDPRQFPYSDWYDEYRRFETGAAPAALLRRFPCDAWCLSLKHRQTIAYFLQSPEWRLLAYGPVAAIFARADPAEPGAAPVVLGDLPRMRAFHQIPMVVGFLISLGDTGAAERVLDAAQHNWRFLFYRSRIGTLRAYVRGIRLFRAGHYRDAIAPLQRAFDAGVVRRPTLLAWSYEHLALAEWRAGNHAAARDAVVAALRLLPESPRTLYNAGIVLGTAPDGAGDDADTQAHSAGTVPDWRACLTQALARQSSAEKLPDSCRATARRRLAGERVALPPLLPPPGAATETENGR